MDGRLRVTKPEESEIGGEHLEKILGCRLFGWLFLLTLITGLGGSLANAQATTAQILGNVVDESGAVIPNATIEVQNTGTGFDRTVRSSSAGEYLIPALPIGTYMLKATATGFKSYAQSGIVLENGQHARVDVVLQVGGATQTIQVSAAETQVDTSSASIRSEVNSTQIHELPLNTRDTLQLITLVPGVGNATGGFGNSGGAATSSLPLAVTNQRSGPMFTVNGNRVNGSEVSLDGAILQTGMYNEAVNLPNPDSIGEFSILTSNYSAKYGHASGGAFVAISKAGTNTFHGSAWEFLRNDALNARNWFAPAPAPKPILKQNQFGVAAGGPILKNKTFFFATYEGLRIHQMRLVNNSTLTPAERAGDFSAIKKQLKDPSTGLPYPNNQIPKSEWDPLSVGFMNTYIPVADPLTGLYTNQWATPITGDQFTGRFDYSPAKRDQMYLRFFRMNATSPAYAGTNASYSNNSSPNWGITVRDTHTFTTNLIGDFGYSDTNFTSNEAPEGILQSPLSMGGVYTTSGFTISPQVSVAGSGNFASGAPYYENTALKQVDGELTWNKGRNLWQFGFLGFHEAYDLNWPSTQTGGVATFNGTYTGFAWADYLIGRPVSFTEGPPYVNSDKSMSYGLYAEDDFRASRRLTLNLGIRYDLMLPWQESGLDSASVTFNSSFHSTRFPVAPPGLAFAGDPGVPPGLVFTDKSDLAPRLGFAYDVFGDGKTAVRGGYGIFYYSPPAADLTLGREQSPFQPNLSFNPHSFSDPYAGTGITDPFPYSFSAQNFLWVHPAQSYSLDPHIKNSFVQQFNLDVQHEFPRDLMIQVGYVGNLGDRLWYGHEDNAAPYSAGGTAANAQSRRPFLPQYYGPVEGMDDSAYSNYNSLQVAVRKRFSAGYTMQLAYTLAKSLDLDSVMIQGQDSDLQDPYNLFAGQYARSDFDQKQLFRFNGVWDLPQFKNLGFMRQFVGGWEAAGIINYSSGTPFTVNVGYLAPWLGPGRFGPLRTNLIGNPCAGCGSRDSWARTGYFNKSAYATPPTGTFGNSGRNSLVGPAYFDTDMSAVKNFPFLRRENSKVQLRADFFNLFNNVPFNNPVAASSSIAFGRILSAGNAREVQLALRLEF